MRPVKLPCGCTYNVTHWLTRCAPHDAEYYDFHRNVGIIHISELRARDPEYVSLRETLVDIAVAGAGGAP